MKSILVLSIVLLFSFIGQAQNDLPKIVISQASFSDADAVHIDYEITDSDNEVFDVSVLISKDGGESYQLYPEIVEGDGTVNGTGMHQLTLVNFSAHASLDEIRIVVDDLYEFSIDEVVALVDSNRIRTYLESIFGVRDHIVAPEKIDEVREYVHLQLFETCRDTFGQSFIHQNIWEARNLFGWQQGTITDTKPYLVGGHYDTVDESPGADDNGTAVAAMLEISKVFEDFNFNYPIQYSSWDFEEWGLVGSKYYISNLDPEIDIQGYLNLEMIGYYSDQPNSQTLPVGFDFLFPDITAEIAANQFRGDFITNVGNAGSSNQMMLDFASASATYVPELSVISVPSPGEGTNVPDLLRSDHAPFWFQGIPALMLTDGSEFRNKNYHTPFDVIDSLNFEFYTNVVKASVAYLAENAEIHHMGVAQISGADIMTSNMEFELASHIECSYVQGSNILRVLWKESNSRVLDWKLIDMQGVVHTSDQWTHSGSEYSVSLEELVSGVYVFSSFDENGSQFNFQFVLE